MGAARRGCGSSTGDKVTHHTSASSPRPATRRPRALKKTANTVSVLQQAPGTIITRAPDEVQWACGGLGAAVCPGDAERCADAARYFRYLTREDSPGAGVARGVNARV
ncbi:unnamed protein product [Pieris macdunnoughi]|uniref:Uncharacterized protein n=1 Tax=Pieris macdunnoughi TaxID=345717 RepID=A0A821US43_9NEOP|nr:unnamed protein product [Pieris macdunnoughi]